MFKFYNKLIFEKNVMANIKNEDILIYNTDSVYLEHVENRYEGRINNINWGNLNKLTDAILSLINKTNGKAQSVAYLCREENDKFRIGSRISILSGDLSIDFHSLVTTFLCDIIKIDNQSGDLFNQNLAIYDQIIKNETQKFLIENGNKPINQKLEIKTSNSLLKISGRFSKVSTIEHKLDDPAVVHVAVVDGLVKHHRQVHLKLNSQTIVAYFKQSDFLQLHGLMLTEEVHQFTIQNKLDAGGKKDLCLISIKEDPENLF